MPGVTKEQIQAAREADLFTYLQFHEPGVLKRDGPNFRHKEHDSLVYVTGKRYWYWNSRGRSINALDYLIQIRGYGLVDAVHALVGGEIRHTPAYRSTAEIQVSKEPEKKAFSLPWARRCATAAVSYLQKRGISSEVIRQCLQAGIFYEARYHGEPVCVFVGKDDSGKAKFACMRSRIGQMIAFLLSGLFGTQKNFVGVIVTVKHTPYGIAIFRVVWIITHRCLGFLHKPVSGLILRRNRDNVNIASSAAETLEIANLGFTALADEIHHRIALSGVGRLAADLFYSAHAAFPPMNGIAP